MNSSILEQIRKARQTAFKPSNPSNIDSNTINFKQTFDSEYDDIYEMKRVLKSNNRAHVDFDEKTIDTMNETRLPIISEKTKQMLDKIKNKKQAAAISGYEKSLGLEFSKTIEGPSVVEAKPFLFRDFDIEKKIKVLPNCLVDLFYLMKEYDAAINMLYIRKTTSFYKDIKAIVRHSLCKENTIQDFTRVLTIAPSLYKFKWVMDERTKSYDLLIDMNYENEDGSSGFRYLSSQKLKERQKLFYFGLVEFLADHTNIKHLIPNLNDGRKGDFSMFESIDMAFDHSLGFSNSLSQTTDNEKLIEKLKEFKELQFEIPQYELPINPGRELRSSKELLDFKKPSLIMGKNRILDQLREKGFISQKQSSSTKSSENDSIAVRQQKVEELKAKLLQKVKENAKKAEIELKKDKVEFIDLNRDLSLMIEQLHFYYNKRHVESMFYCNVLKYLERNYPKDYTIDELDKLVKILIERVPDWISLVVISQQSVLRVKQGYNVKLLMKEFM